MRPDTFIYATTFALAGAAGAFGVEPGKEAVSGRVARLVKQLGDDSFAKREAASRELEAIGTPALAVLRKARASDADLEIRRRAQQILEVFATRARQRERAKWAGSSGKALTGPG